MGPEINSEPMVEGRTRPNLRNSEMFSEHYFAALSSLVRNGQIGAEVYDKVTTLAFPDQKILLFGY